MPFRGFLGRFEPLESKLYQTLSNFLELFRSFFDGVFLVVSALGFGF